MKITRLYEGKALGLRASSITSPWRQLKVILVPNFGPKRQSLFISGLCWPIYHSFRRISSLVILCMNFFYHWWITEFFLDINIWHKNFFFLQKINKRRHFFFWIYFIWCRIFVSKYKCSMNYILWIFAMMFYGIFRQNYFV